MVAKRFYFLKAMFEGQPPWIKIVTYFINKEGIKHGRRWQCHIRFKAKVLNWWVMLGGLLIRVALQR